MKILFLGGTKFFGKLIVEELIKDPGNEVTVLSRRGFPYPHRKITQVFGCRNDPHTIAQLDKNYDAVIDNIAYTAREIELLFLRVSTKQYIVTSSIASYYPEVSEYSRNKLEMEKFLWNSDIPWLIMRPGIVYGPGDPLGKTVSYIKNRINHTSNSRISFVFSEDLVRAYVSAIWYGWTDKMFDLCHPQALTINEFMEIHRDWRKENGYYNIKEDGDYFFEHDFIGHPAYAMEMLNWKPTPWEKAVEKTLPWIKDQIK